MAAVTAGPAVKHARRPRPAPERPARHHARGPPLSFPHACARVPAPLAEGVRRPATLFAGAAPFLPSPAPPSPPPRRRAPPRRPHTPVIAPSRSPLRQRAATAPPLRPSYSAPSPRPSATARGDPRGLVPTSTSATEFSDGPSRTARGPAVLGAGTVAVGAARGKRRSPHAAAGWVGVGARAPGRRRRGLGGRAYRAEPGAPVSVAAAARSQSSSPGSADARLVARAVRRGSP